MDATKLINSLESFGIALPGILTGVPEDDARWKPPSGAWSILEIVRHLGDEEVDDFRARLKSTLENPEEPWPAIDPEAWAVERRYNEADFTEAVKRFSCERTASIQWLRGLESPDWSLAYQHPKVGPVPAGQLLASWRAHDCLHLRQIAKRMHELARRHGEPYPIDYAGEWRA